MKDAAKSAQSGASSQLGQATLSVPQHPQPVTRREGLPRAEYARSEQAPEGSKGTAGAVAAGEVISVQSELTENAREDTRVEKVESLGNTVMREGGREKEHEAGAAKEMHEAGAAYIPPCALLVRGVEHEAGAAKEMREDEGTGKPAQASLAGETYTATIKAEENSTEPSADAGDAHTVDPTGRALSEAELKAQVMATLGMGGVAKQAAGLEGDSRSGADSLVQGHEVPGAGVPHATLTLAFTPDLP